MKRVNYKKLSIANFLSIGKDPVEIEFSKGIHIITGVNKDKTDRKNGVGKSAIACAFYFAHFGEAIRDIKRDLIANDITNGKTEVILDVEVIDNGSADVYKIVRSLQPSKLDVFKNGTNVTLSSIPKTTEFICEILGITPSLMTNCVVMTINETIPFMAKSKADKRKFIEDVFDLDVFSRMVTELKKDFRETKRDKEIKDALVKEIKHTVVTLKEQKDKLEEKKNERLELYKKRRAENVKERDELNKKIKGYQPIDIKAVEDKIDKYSDAVIKLGEKRTDVLTNKIQKDVDIQNSVREKAGIEDIIKAGICNGCKRSVEHNDIDHYNTHFNAIDSNIQKYTQERDTYDAEVKKITDQRMKLSQAIEKLHNDRRELTKQKEERKTEVKRLEQINEWVAELDKDIEIVEKSNNDFIDNIKKEAERLKKNAVELKELEESYKVLESVKFVLGDEGVKTHIIKKLIDMLNVKLAHYTRRLDGNCICKFNEYFEEEIISTKNKIRSYFNFSGAEKKAVDLGCLFSFSDIKRMQGGVSYNVSMYDELFDSSLDETGVNLVIDILNDKVEDNDECVIIISHRKEAIKAVTGEVIYLEKKNDITRRVDYKDSDN